MKKKKKTIVLFFIVTLVLFLHFVQVGKIYHFFTEIKNINILNFP